MTTAGGEANDTPHTEFVVRESCGRCRGLSSSVFLRAMMGFVRMGTEFVGVGSRRAAGETIPVRGLCADIGITPWMGDVWPWGDGGVGGRECNMTDSPRRAGDLAPLMPRVAGEGEGEALPGGALLMTIPGGREIDATDMWRWRGPSTSTIARESAS